MTVGLLRPAVVLPPGLAAAVEPGQLRDVLVHECAHVCRRDQWVGLAQRLVAIALWPQPLIYLLNRELGRAREEVCDNHVLAGQPDPAEARGYARALLALAESMRDAGDGADRRGRNGPRRPLTDTPLPAIGILGPGWPLEARVAGLLDTRRTVMTRLTLKTRLLAITCFCAVAIAVAGTRILAAAADDDPKPAAAPANPSAKPGVRGADGARPAATRKTPGRARDPALDQRADSSPPSWTASCRRCHSMPWRSATCSISSATSRGQRCRRLEGPRVRRRRPQDTRLIQGEERPLPRA